MTDLTLTDRQAEGVRAIKTWFADLEQNCPRKEDFEGLGEKFDFNQEDTNDPFARYQQIFRVLGYAGTGKSTLVDYAIKELGLNTFGEVLFGTFTGKASYVLRRKGIPTAQTIHSMIYSVSEATEAQVEEQRQKIEQLRIEAMSGPPGEARLKLQTEIVAEEQKLKEMKRPTFGLSPNSPVPNCRLVVLDECSMVGPEMAADLLSFGKPILVLGDPGQLPPIKGEGAFTQQEPDVMLTEIHRQAAESPIIYLATLAREGRRIDYGRYSDEVWKLRRTDVEPAHLLKSDQVICGMNATRLALNNAMRKIAGFEGEIPVDGDKIICLKNNNDKGLINGMFLTLSDISRDVDKPDLYFLAAIHDEEGNPIGGVDRAGKLRQQSIYAGHFLDHVQLDKDRMDRDWRVMKPFVQASFGYAITAHKSQGSSWGNVCVWDDGLGRSREDRQRWLYTALTRAESGLLLLD